MTLKDIAYTKISLTELEALRAEIERLLDAKGRMRVDLANAQSDNERLRALLAEAREVIGNDVGPYGDELAERIDRALERKS